MRAVNADDGPDYRHEEGEVHEEPPGFSELCPVVQASIVGSHLAPFLPRDWDAFVTVEKLERLHSLLEPGLSPAGLRPDTSGVAGIVKRMEESQVVRERSLWQRFKDWIKELLSGRAQAQDSDWLADWLREHMPSESALRIVMFTILVLLIATVAWIVYVELRAAGLLSRQAARAAIAGRTAGTINADDDSPALDEASDVELPPLLITHLLGQLRRLGRVQDRGSMTHRELARAARFDAAAERDTFRELLTVSERIRYGAVVPEAAGLGRVIAESRRLLESLARLPRGAT